MAQRSPLLDIPGDLGKTITGAFRVAGKSSRTEVWTWLLIANFVAVFLKGLVEYPLGETEMTDPTLASSIVTVAFLLPIPALMARRLHDIGRSGWLALYLPPSFVLAAITAGAQPSLIGVDKVFDGWFASTLVALGVLLCFALALIPPQEGENRYGADPRSRRRTAS